MTEIGPILIVCLTVFKVDHFLLETTMVHGGQMAERLGNRATNQKVAGSITGRKMLLCPRARHFTLLAWGGMSLYLL